MPKVYRVFNPDFLSLVQVGVFAREEDAFRVAAAFGFAWEARHIFGSVEEFMEEHTNIPDDVRERLAASSFEGRRRAALAKLTKEEKDLLGLVPVATGVKPPTATEGSNQGELKVLPEPTSCEPGKTVTIPRGPGEETTLHIDMLAPQIPSTRGILADIRNGELLTYRQGVQIELLETIARALCQHIQGGSDKVFRFIGDVPEDKLLDRR